LLTKAGWCFVLVLLQGVAMSGCSGARRKVMSGRTAPATDVSAVGFASLLGREVGPLPERSVRFANPAWSARTEAEAAPEVSLLESTTVVDIPIGTQDPIRCYVYADDVDPGGTLGRVLGDAARHAQYERVFPVDVRVEADAPALHVGALYTTRGPAGDRVAGQLELLFHALPGHPVLCVHDELGYTKSFRRVALGFSSSLRTELVPPTSRWLEVQVARIGKTPVGFTRRALVASETGGVRTLETSSFMLPMPDQTWVFEDEGSYTDLDAAGRIERAVFAQFSGGSELMNLRIERQEGAYQVQGKRAGQTIFARFSTRDPNGLPGPTLVGQWLDQRDRVEVEEFRPNLSVTEPVTVTYQRLPEGPRRVAAKLGPAELVGRLDARGLFDHLELTANRTTTVFDRVLSRGEI
jgi:hypothetical protein